MAITTAPASLSTVPGVDAHELLAVALFAKDKRAKSLRRAKAASGAAIETAGAATKEAAGHLAVLADPARTLGADPELNASIAWLGNTSGAYYRDVRQFAAWVAERGGNLTTVRPAAVAQWQDELAARFASSTTARKVAAVSSFYTFTTLPGTLAEGRLIPEQSNPVAYVSRVEPSSVPTAALTAEETRALLDAADRSKHHPRDRALVLAMATAGVRVSELCDALVGDLQWIQGSCVLQLTGKGNKTRQVPLAPEVCALVEIEGRPADAPLFQGNDGGPLDRYKVGRILARLQKAAGIKTKITPHVLRATQITEALAVGVDLWAVADNAGHADTRTTRGYQRRGQSVQAKNAMAASLAARFTG